MIYRESTLFVFIIAVNNFLAAQSSGFIYDKWGEYTNCFYNGDK